MSIDRGISSCSSERLVLPIGNVLMRFYVPVLKRQTEVNNIEDIGFSSQTDEEVIGLDISVYEVFIVEELEPRDHLIRQHENRFYREFPVADIEKIFKRWT